MYRYNENWENSISKYESNLLKNLEVNDFTIRGSFSFWDKYLKFNGRRIFNTIPESLEKKSRLTSSSNYALEMLFSPYSNLILSHTDSGVATIEGEYHIWQNDTKDHSIRMYGKHLIEGASNLTTSNQIVYNYGLDYMLNAGIRDWKVIAGDKNLPPETFTLGGMMRFTGDPKLHSWGGLQFAFGTRNFTEVKAQMGVFTPDINGVVHVGMQRKSETIITPLTTNQIAEKITYPKYLQLGLEAKLSDTFFLFNNFKSTLNGEFHAENQLGGLYTFDPYTSMKFKVADDFSTTLSITRRFRNLFDFTFSGNFNFKRPVKSEILTSSTTVSTPTASTTVTVTTPKHFLSHISSKFGVAIEILDEMTV